MDKKVNNGRVIIQEPNPLTQIGLYDKIPMKETAYIDAVNGIYYDTDLSNLFFNEFSKLVFNFARIGLLIFSLIL